MLFWFIYIFSSLLISYLASTFFSSKTKTFILFLVLALMLTPENMGIGSQEASPVVFSFIFELFFEQSMALRTLRPLVFSLPVAFILSAIVLRFKKRFSQI